MNACVSVDPFRCRLWNLHDRLEEHISEANCAKEIESFNEHRQRVPGLGRPIHNDPDYDVEVICGARRLFVARLLRLPFLVEIRELSDREAIIEKHIDRLRKDISPYERGLGYLRWLRGGYFKTQEEMSRALRVSNSKVSRLLKLAQLPSVIVGAFDSAVNIRERWGLHLAEILKDAQQRDFVIQAAREVQNFTPRLPPKEVYRRLLASGARTARGNRKLKKRDHDEVITGNDGVPLFRVRQQINSIALLLPIEGLSAKALSDIENAVRNILQDVPGKQSDADAGEHGNWCSHTVQLAIASDPRVAALVS